MPTMKQLYEETTNLEYEAMFFALTCLQNDIPFAINPPQSDKDDRFTLHAYYNEDNMEILKDMDNLLKYGGYNLRDMDINDIDAAVICWKNR